MPEIVVIILLRDKSRTAPIGKIIELLRRAIPTVLGCKEYREEKKLLERADRVMRGKRHADHLWRLMS
jgi:hypothetical protein